MKKSVIRLLEGSPSKFFDDIRAKLDDKASTIVESVAATVADTVFDAELEEAKTFGKQTNVAGEANAKIKKGATDGKKPDKLKKVSEDVELYESWGTQTKDGRTGHTGLKSKKEAMAKAAEWSKKFPDHGPYQVVGKKKVNEDMGVHTISTTRGGKNAKTFATLVVNKKRVSPEAKQRKWSDLIKKATPKETEWDRHTKQ